MFDSKESANNVELEKGSSLIGNIQQAYGDINNVVNVGANIADMLALTKESGLSQGYIESFFLSLGEENVPRDQWHKELIEKAEELKELRHAVAHMRTKDETSAALQSNAQNALNKENFEKAAELFHAYNAHLTQTHKQQDAIRAEGFALEAKSLRLKLKPGYAEAAALYAKAALFAEADRDLHITYLEASAYVYKLYGYRKGENPALQKAIALYRALLTFHPRADKSGEWANTQNNLGNVLSELGERESGTIRLEEAVTAYRAILEEHPREHDPLIWAITQSNLGAALTILGNREDSTIRLEEAITAYRAALEEHTRDRVPLSWAMTQHNLGTTLTNIEQRGNGTIRLKEAITAFHAVLEERKRDCVPLDWAKTQNNLGNALSILGQREGCIARLKEAATAYCASLKERTRERVPLEWAMTQNNLGNVFLILGECESDTTRLEGAVTAYRAALEEHTRKRVPLEWAMTQNNLGNALSILGAHERSIPRLEEAVTAYLAALEEYTRERVPLQWAGTRYNIGGVYLALYNAGEADKRALAKKALTDAYEIYAAANHIQAEYAKAELDKLNALPPQ